MNDEDLTPLMRQYREIKHRYPHAILFFRVGDFYEMFFEDAETASRLLSIALTSRDKQSPQPVPLCGVPHHAATGYIAKLLKAGKTVALCEQVEDPKTAKGLVRREVVRLYTPGTLVDTDLLAPNESNYLSALSFRPNTDRPTLIGLAAIDVSTGEFWVTEFHGSHAISLVSDELSRLEPREVLLPSGFAEEARMWIDRVKGARLCERHPSSFDRHASIRLLLDQFGVPSLDVFGCQDLTAGIEAAGAVLQYVRESQPGASSTHIRRIAVRRSKEFMHLDGSTIRNLELLRPMAPVQDGSRSVKADLISTLDRTSTAMGARLLREWIVRPLVDCDQIRARHEAVGELKDRWEDRTAIRACLKDVQDVARLGSRIVLGYSTPRELLALKKSLSVLPALFALLDSLQSSLLAEIRKSSDDGKDLHDIIEQAIHPDAPLSVRDANIIKDGYHQGIDEWRKASKDGKQWIADLEGKERIRTGIDSLKVRYNQVHGYYIEVTKSNLHRVPPDYIRKQTLVGAERFMTQELRALEERITTADVKLAALEQEVFGIVLSRLSAEAHRLEKIAAHLALIDVIAGLAETAALLRYTKPLVDNSGRIAIQEGRHPIVEQLRDDRSFVPNDTMLDLEGNRLLILTGPNMAGKSTYLRQVALIVLMAQLGSFVPAASAHIGVVDRIFTRVGASDNLSGGLSTFMVEMVETAHILNNATPRSLILLDEIGRGTSTYDGLSIAWAVAEYIHDRGKLGARTLFATHYHELAQLAFQQEGIKNYRVAVQERGGDVIFLHKIIEGGADRSYGIHVAKLAGLPGCVIERATAILSQLEESETGLANQADCTSRDLPQPSPQPHLLVEREKQMDLFAS
ncbi:MAG: DNA mismatch repair protein MutS [Nitrospira sp.]|nr:DNA mismatch repair protein MutS [Nitrospira sp.]MCP9462369.1 DNA mismatch repair protein MutS [Nitrospira sp.]MCP9474456.1 DNA mismatch repair protein MutS [Nitrospira sp.]